MYKVIKILRIDVEGMDFKVLKGALKTIRTGRPYIILEIHNREEAEAKDFLEKLNYKVVVLSENMYMQYQNSFECFMTMVQRLGICAMPW